MRVTQRMMTRRYLKNLNNSIKNYSDTNSKLSSMREFSRISENPADGMQALRLRDRMSDAEQYLVNLRDAEGQLSSGETNLRSVHDILKTVHEKTLAGMNGATGPEAREIISREIGNLKGEVLQFVNAQYSEKFLFSGTNNSFPPFAIGEDGRLTYNGISVDSIVKEDEGYFFDEDGDGTGDQRVPQDLTRYLDVGLGLMVTGDEVDPKSAFQISISGLDVLGCGKDADGDSKNIFNLLDDIENAMAGDPFDMDKVGKLHDKLVSQMDDLMLNITDIGNRTQFMEQTVDRYENDLLNMSKTQANLESIDTPTVSMDLKMHEFSWMATLQIGSKIIPPSLFDFMN